MPGSEVQLALWWNRASIRLLMDIRCTELQAGSEEHHLLSHPSEHSAPLLPQADSHSLLSEVATRQKAFHTLWGGGMHSLILRVHLHKQLGPHSIFSRAQHLLLLLTLQGIRKAPGFCSCTHLCYFSRGNLAFIRAAKNTRHVPVAKDQHQQENQGNKDGLIQPQ